jgi:hypothetical protein
MTKKEIKRLYKDVECREDRADAPDHHPKSVELFEHLRTLDCWLFDDFFDWKAGGDGDNGEVLMYALDMYFDRCDQTPDPVVEALKLSRQMLSHPELIAAEQLAAAHGHEYSDRFSILARRTMKLTQKVLDVNKG